MTLWNQPWSVPEVLRPLYESSMLLAQRTTMAVRLLFLSNNFHCTLVMLYDLKLWNHKVYGFHKPDIFWWLRASAPCIDIYLFDKDIKGMEFGLNCFCNHVIVIQALRHLRQISQEVSQPNVTGWGRRPAALRALSQRLSKFVPLFFTLFLETFH